MASAGPPEHRRPSLIDINLASVERRRREGPPPISPFSIIVFFLILILAYAIFPFVEFAEDSDIPNLYGVWHEQQEDIDSLKDTLAEREARRDLLMSPGGPKQEADALREQTAELESLLGAMELDYGTLSQSTVTWSEVLEAIEDAAPVGVNILSITQGSSVAIEGTAATDALISEYAAALEDTGLFSDVDITEHELGGTASPPSDIIIEDCEDEWNPRIGVFCLKDWLDYQVGLYSAKQSITDAFTTGLVAYENVAEDLPDAKYVVFWVKSSADQPAGVFQLVFYSPSFEPYTPTPTSKQYTNNTDVIIPDPIPPDPGEWVNSDIAVPYADDLIITDVDVYVKIVHTDETDLVVRLRHPDGTEYLLHNHADEPGAGIDRWYPAPGDLPITIFDSKHSYGTWQLRVQDTVDVPVNTGSIDSWTLKITGTTPVTPAPTPTPTPAPTPVPTATPTAWPVIDYSPLSFCFSASEGTDPSETNPSDKTLEISNSGGGTLNWQVTSNAPWLSLSPTSGSSTGEVDIVAVSVDVTGSLWLPPSIPMSAGSYTGTITISGREAVSGQEVPNSPQKVPVYLTIREPTMVERLDIPGLTADTWREVTLTLSDASKICPDYSVGLYATRDPGACIVWLDDIRATIEATPGPYSFVITVTLAGGGE